MEILIALGLSFVAIKLAKWNNRRTYESKTKSVEKVQTVVEIGRNGRTTTKTTYH